MASRIGAALEAPPPGLPAHAFWFGEDQARYVVTVPAARMPEIEAIAAKKSVPLWKLGRTGGDRLTLPGERPILVSALQVLHESWFPAYMLGSSG